MFRPTLLHRADGGQSFRNEATCTQSLDYSNRSTPLSQGISWRPLVMASATRLTARTALSLSDSKFLGFLTTGTSALRCLSAVPTSLQPTRSNPNRTFTTSPQRTASNNSLLGLSSGPPSPSSYFQRPALPANTIIRFVPQQTAWIVERMGKFNRILQPGLAVLIPFLDRIAYVRSLKEAAIEIPSQSAITADNVTLELDGVLYTRVFDAYKARCGLKRSDTKSGRRLSSDTATASKMPNTPSRSLRRQPCAPKSGN